MHETPIDGLMPGPMQPRGVGDGKDDEEIGRLVRIQYAANRILTVFPTVALAGMYGAATFAMLSLGPAWLGFLIGAIPPLVIAVWAGGEPNSR